MIVDVQNFGMTFGKNTIVRDLSFDVAAGETFGLLGSNGSGKTTTLRALLGTIAPTRGTLHINGQTYHAGADTKVGYLPEERGLYRKDSAIEIMSYFGELKGLPRQQARAWSSRYLGRVGLGEKARVRLERLSGGQQQKIQLGIAIMGEPDLLILDEPAKGLDPVNRRLLMELIAERREAGSAVILVTHNMDEVERLCSRALLLKDGRAEAYGTVRDIQSSMGSRRIRMRLSGPIPESLLFHVVSRRVDEIIIEPTQGVADEEILEFLVTSGARPNLFEPRSASLEEVFLKVYGNTPQEVNA
ncbi:ABC transporter ATP-binding protein [Leifsonia aquatica]|uniref:ABC transporter ATP-binding protein n=1 Tax=Leifsonia aquatica TaxID=144185 RepID=UPI00384E3A7A